MTRRIPLPLAAGLVPLSLSLGFREQFQCNHEVVQEEAKQAQRDLEKNARAGVRRWIQKTGWWVSFRPRQRLGKPRGGSRKRRRSAPSSGSSAKCSKTQSRLYLRIKYLHISFSYCPATIRLTNVTLFCKRKGYWPFLAAPI